jgi:hypothetical protein
LLAMSQAFGAAIDGIAHVLQRQNGVERRDRAGTGDDLGMRFGTLGNLEVAAAGGSSSFAPDGASLNAAGAFDFHGRLSQCDTAASPNMVKEGLCAPGCTTLARTDRLRTGTGLESPLPE